MVTTQRQSGGMMDLGTHPRILISRTDRIGDVVLSLPVARALHAAYPQATIDFLVRGEVAPLVDHQPDINGYLVYDCNSEQSTWNKEIAARAYDAVICLYPRPELAREFSWAKIPVRVGTARRWYSWRFTHRINISRRDSGRHEKDLNFDLLGALGIEPDYGMVPELTVQAEKDQHAGLLEQIDNSKPLVVVHPGHGGSAVNWSLERYLELAQRLVETGSEVIISGSKTERETYLAAGSNTIDEDHVLAGRTDLQALMHILKRANLFVGGSTGPLHIAAAMGTPVVGLYGPVRSTTPDRWGPCGTGHRVFTPDVPMCSCRVDACKLGDCMDYIQVADVLAACQDLMTPNISEQPPPIPNDNPVSAD